MKTVLKPIVFGGHSFHPAWAPAGFLDEDAYLALLRHAFDSGIRQFDATIEAEVQVLGRLFRKWGPPAGVTVGCLQAYPITPSPADQRAQLLRWLELLGVTSLEFLYLFPAPKPEQAEELRRQKAEGLFRKLGLWLRTPDEVVDPTLFDFVAGVHNPARRELAGRFAELRKQGVGVAVLESLGGSALLANRAPEEQRRIAKALLQFSASQPWCDSVFVSMRTPQEVTDNAQAIEEFLQRGADLQALERAASAYPEDFNTWKGGFEAFSAPWNGKFGPGVSST